MPFFAHWVRPLMNSRTSPETAMAANMVENKGITCKDGSALKQIRLLQFCGIRVPILNPNSSPVIRRWETLNVVALLYIAVVTPYEAALLDTKLNGLYVVNRVIDCIFIANMFLSFIVMYPMKTRYGHVLQTNPRVIAKQYLQGWFIVDLMSLLPFDSLGLILNNQKLKNMKVIKVVKMLRMLKLVRVIKANRIVKKWKMTLSITHANLSLLKFLVVIIVWGHWFSCLWALVGKSMIGPAYNNPGLETAGLEPNGHVSWIEVSCGCTTCEHDCDTVCQPCRNDHFGVYAAALHFSVMTLTSIGYGDIVPTYKGERLAGSVFMLFSGVLWAYIIGSACGVIANKDRHEQAFKQTLDDLNYMMHEKQLPNDVRRRLRIFFYQTKDVLRQRTYKKIVHQLSPALQGEVAALLNSIWVEKIWYLKETGEAMKIALAQALETRLFAQGEMFGEARTLYVLSRGLVGRKGKVLCSSSVWGEDFILDNNGLVDYTRSMALTYVEVTWMCRRALDAMLEQFPEERPKIRKAQIILALTRAIIVIAESCRSRSKTGNLWFSMQDTSKLLSGSLISNRYKNTQVLTPEGNELFRLLKIEGQDVRAGMQQMSSQFLQVSQSSRNSYEEILRCLRSFESAADNRHLSVKAELDDMRQQFGNEIGRLREEITAMRMEGCLGGEHLSSTSPS